ncbi:uncharacterized protein N7459_000952 [Penicillium hispanicum]|uniref:uncharacterized protein n=1 Tax=Penicillium hispanicum TaxID=1080232 RepID=UPI00254250A5|nr:uncharacterized protein N7459_000952 [Penicillium hispanicum]KAJ5594744.1 hypothetical protein N7459_000952 [Penicillium hispanicum]
MLSLTILAALVSLATANPRSGSLSVDTTVGTVVGVNEPAVPGVVQWLSVPYAEPPVGARRFLPPVAKNRGGLIHASQPPASCQQWLTTKKDIYNQLDPQFLPPGPFSEDCLYLNIIAPKSPKSESLPVLLWLHGGEETWGGINTPYEKPHQWVQRSQEHIVVQINYRVNIFGFPNAKGLNQSQLNPGILDQRLAVEWVRDNIAKFGGNPEQMVFWGSSSGGALGDNYQYAYAKDPIIKGFITQSAVAYMANLSSDPGQTSFSYIAKQFNCSGKHTSAAQEVECMRKVDAGKIETFLQQHSDSGATPTLAFIPAADGKTAFTQAQYAAMASNPKIPKLPGLVGSNLDDGAWAVTFSQAGPGAKTVALATAKGFQCPIAEYLNDRVTGDGKTFRYLYGGNFTNISPLPWVGSFHFSEIPLVTGTHPNYRGNSTSFEYKLSETMQDLWLAFAKDPTGGLAAKGWPQLTANGSLLALGVNDVLRQVKKISAVDQLCASLS